MSKTGFLCPNCNSWDNEYIYGSTRIICYSCGNEWDPGEDGDCEDDDQLTCPRCGSDDLDIDDEGEFHCNGCGLEGDVEAIED